MKYYSTNNETHFVSGKKAVLSGLAPDGGLFMPKSFPSLDRDFINNLCNFSFIDIATTISEKFFSEEISLNDLKSICTKAFNFPIPVKHLTSNLHILELFHGPTLAFKDFGARFMAQIMSYYLQNDNKKIKILVATSGDTGSAVASGFFNVPSIEVILLYPKGKVSKTQEQMLTTMGGNITALEVTGVFDDCQNLVKQAFCDPELKKLNLASANSINIARLLPQSFYYFSSAATVDYLNKDLIFSVPSGNLGNLTGGIFASKLGLPINRLIASNNANNAFINYLNNGIFEPKPSVSTISNAMDVGNPSNFARIIDIFNRDIEKIRSFISGYSFNDQETKDMIKNIFKKHNYLIDPHTAVSALGANTYLEKRKDDCEIIAISTAHPGKFSSVIEQVLNEQIELPDTIKEAINKEKQSLLIKPDYQEFKNFLLQ